MKGKESLYNTRKGAEEKCFNKRQIKGDTFLPKILFLDESEKRGNIDRWLKRGNEEEKGEQRV